MSVNSQFDNKKWLNAAVALVSLLVGYVLLSFLYQLGEWFELEAKVSYFTAVAQVLSVVSGLTVFLYITKNAKTADFLLEVFSELKKVAWPERKDTTKQTGVILVLVVIAGLILSFFDFLAHLGLSQLN